MIEKIVDEMIGSTKISLAMLLSKDPKKQEEVVERAVNPDEKPAEDPNAITRL
jgi:hypothetical protein